MIGQSPTQLVEELEFINADIAYYLNLKDLLGFSQQNLDEIDKEIVLCKVREQDVAKRLSAMIQ
jgi:hypothetical protein